MLPAHGCHANRSHEPTCEPPPQGRRHAVVPNRRSGWFIHDSARDRNARITDIDLGPGYELRYLSLGFSAERTLQTTASKHFCLPCSSVTNRHTWGSQPCESRIV